MDPERIDAPNRISGGGASLVASGAGDGVALLRHPAPAPAPALMKRVVRPRQAGP